jgi:hypothetical protein
LRDGLRPCIRVELLPAPRVHSAPKLEEAGCCVDVDE